MASKQIHIQIPADVHSLVQLLARLRMLPGVMKAYRLADDRINIWFIAAEGAANIKRASARLVRGVSEVYHRSPRRVYLDLRVQNYAGAWRDIGDEDFRAAGLQPAWEYDGPSHIGISYDAGRNEGEWWNAGTESVVNATDSVAYYRLLPGDRDRAIAEAKQRIESFSAPVR
ncbi:MAG: hypothetical protein HY461_03385 [Parcubacteria group bacterium]|nr:hypothetical protein [Parcubacteria group bacterium]